MSLQTYSWPIGLPDDTPPPTPPPGSGGMSFELEGPTRCDDLCDFGRTSLPRYVFAQARTEEEIEAICAQVCLALGMAEGWVRQTYRLTAEKRWLDELGKDRAVYRREGESDAEYAARMGSVEDSVNVASILDIANTILVAGGLDPDAAIVELKRDRAWLGVSSSTGRARAYSGRGYRCGNDLPATIIVVLPYGTTAAMAAAVLDAVRLKKAGGIACQVEYRQAPVP